MTGKTLAPSTITVVALSGQTDFPIPFDYLARKFVVLTLLGRDRKVLTLNTDYRFVSKTVISLSNPSPVGYDKLEIRRETSATERLVDFHDGSILRAYDLNLSQVQTLHVAEEARDLTADTIGVNDDGDLDARGRKIVNLAEGLRGSNDAANMKQLDEYDKSTLQNRDKAIQARNEAEQFARNAHDSDQHAGSQAALAINNANKAEQQAGIATTKAAEAAKSAADADASYKKIVPLEQSTVANAGSAASSAQVAEDARDVVLHVRDSVGAMPVGAVAMFTTATLPAGWLALNGQSFSVTAYPALAKIFPNGVLPNWENRQPKGAGWEVKLGEFKSWEHFMPAHGHNFSATTSAAGLHNHGRGTMEIYGEFHGSHASLIRGNSTSGVFRTAGNFDPYRLSIESNSAGGYQGASFAASRNWTGVTSDNGNHTHTISGTTATNSSGTRIETDRVGVVFGIKAAGGATSEDFINVSQYEERLRALENDFVRGSNENGSYIKFNNGRLVCEFNGSVQQAVVDSYAAGTTQLYQSVRRWDFPYPFYRQPITTVGRFHWGNGASWGTVAGGGADYATLRIFDIVQRASGPTELIVRAEGWWK